MPWSKDMRKCKIRMACDGDALTSFEVVEEGDTWYLAFASFETRHGTHHGVDDDGIDRHLKQKLADNDVRCAPGHFV